MKTIEKMYAELISKRGFNFVTYEAFELFSDEDQTYLVTKSSHLTKLPKWWEDFLCQILKMELTQPTRYAFYKQVYVMTESELNGAALIAMSEYAKAQGYTPASGFLQLPVWWEAMTVALWAESKQSRRPEARLMFDFESLGALAYEAMCKAGTSDAGAVVVGDTDRVAKAADDKLVSWLADAMTVRLASARAKGRYGWEDHSACTITQLWECLYANITKVNAEAGDYLDAVNYAAFILYRLTFAPLPETERQDLSDWVKDKHGAGLGMDARKSLREMLAALLGPKPLNGMTWHEAALAATRQVERLKQVEALAAVNTPSKAALKALGDFGVEGEQLAQIKGHRGGITLGLSLGAESNATLQLEGQEPQPLHVDLALTGGPETLAALALGSSLNMTIELEQKAAPYGDNLAIDPTEFIDALQRVEAQGLHTGVWAVASWLGQRLGIAPLPIVTGALSDAVSAGQVAPYKLYWHKKGGIYTEIMRARLASDAKEGDEVTVYRNAFKPSLIWVRSVAEFDDPQRFAPITASEV